MPAHRFQEASTRAREIWPSILIKQPSTFKNMTVNSRINKHFRTWKTEVHKVPSWSCTSFNLGYVTISFQPPFSKPSCQLLEFWTQQRITSSHVLLFSSNNIFVPSTQDLFTGTHWHQFCLSRIEAECWTCSTINLLWLLYLLFQT